MTITRDAMTAHIRAGRAQPWTEPLGPRHEVPAAVRMDNDWYVIYQGYDAYQPAPPELVDILETGHTALALADNAARAAGAAQ